MSDYVQALALGLDPAWRHLPAERRSSTAASFEAAMDAGGIVTETYSLIGLKPGIDVLVWRLGPSVEALEEAAARLLRSGVGASMTVRQSFLGLIRESQYVAKATSQEQSLFRGERSRYLVVYPFTKSTDWYLSSREVRQGSMNEHMRVGHGYPQVRQLLAYSFGLDDQDFLVAYETDDLAAFFGSNRQTSDTSSRGREALERPRDGVVRKPGPCRVSARTAEG